MATQNTSELKEKIISVFKARGPCLPVEIAKETGLSILFASAFLSEFLSEKKLQMSNMRVGGSPLYLLKGQEPMLERFSDYLKSKEKEAFLKIKESKILKDRNQDPAIRVALREIKDFAVPFKKDDEIYWRYLTVSEQEVRNLFGNEDRRGLRQKEKSEEKKEEMKIPEKSLEKKGKKPREVKRKTQRKFARSKKDEKFFEKIKEFLKEKDFELEDILGFGKNQFVLLINKDNRKRILVAYNKQRVNEKDLSNASKIAERYGLRYVVLSKSGILKKIKDIIDSSKNMDSADIL